jgi:hypothetical protein
LAVPARWTRIIQLGAILLAEAKPASGRPPGRRFEPTDLEMEEPGVIDIDLQVGAIEGPTKSRVVAPDFELDLGLWHHLELDLDGAWASGGEYEPLWLSVKLAAGWLGLQVGPRLPVGQQDGVGVEGLVLASARVGATTVVVNLGALVDTAPDATSARPIAVQGGFTADLDLGAPKLHVEVGAVGYLSDDPNQIVGRRGWCGR